MSLVILGVIPLALLLIVVGEFLIRRRFPAQGSVLHQKIAYRELLTAILLMIPSAGAMMLTYFGVLGSLGETGNGHTEKGQALIFSLSIGVFAWLGWFYLYGVLMYLRGWLLTAALAAGIFYVGLLSAIDAPMNMMALAGATATKISLVATADAYEERKDTVTNKGFLARSLLPAIRSNQKRFEDLAADETAHGTHSGKKGAGKVSSGFTQVAGLLGKLAEELEAGLAAADEVEQELTAALAGLKEQVYRQGPINERMQAASLASDKLDALLARLGQYDFSVSIEATLRSLEAIFPAPTPAKSDFERTQNAQLAIIADMAKPVAASLRDALRQSQGAAMPARDKVRPLTPHDAIFAYWRQLVPQWSAAAFIEFAPGALLIIMIAAYRQNRRDQPDGISRPTFSRPRLIASNTSIGEIS